MVIVSGTGVVGGDDDDDGLLGGETAGVVELEVVGDGVLSVELAASSLMVAVVVIVIEEGSIGRRRW